MQNDRFGLPLSIDSEEAAGLYIQAVDLILSANDGAEARLQQALALEPGFALAHAALARLWQMQGRANEAREAALRGRELAAGLTERERGHAEPVALLIEGRGGDAYAAVLAQTKAFPRDALPLSLALGVYGLIGFSGRADHHQVQRDLLESLAPHWEEDWWFLTYRGWSRAETGAPAEGVPFLERALALNPRNAHGAHARAHAYYEAGEPQAGMAFIADWLPDYDTASQLHCHLSWHLALFALQCGDAERALTIYDTSIRPAVAQSPPLFTLADAASLLWRLEACGHEAAPQARADVAAYAAKHFPQAGLAFADVHAALAAAGNGEEDAVMRRVGALDDLVAGSKLPAGDTVPALARGIAAFGRDDYDAAIEAFEGALNELPRIGGSNAQRDVIVDSLIVACLRAGRAAEAEAAMTARASHRASHLDAAWLARIAT